MNGVETTIQNLFKTFVKEALFDGAGETWDSEMWRESFQDWVDLNLEGAEGVLWDVEQEVEREKEEGLKRDNG